MNCQHEGRSGPRNEVKTIEMGGKNPQSGTGRSSTESARVNRLSRYPKKWTENLNMIPKMGAAFAYLEVVVKMVKFSDFGQNSEGGFIVQHKIRCQCRQKQGFLNIHVNSRTHSVFCLLIIRRSKKLGFVDVHVRSNSLCLPL